MVSGFDVRSRGPHSMPGCSPPCFTGREAGLEDKRFLIGCDLASVPRAFTPFCLLSLASDSIYRAIIFPKT